MSLHYPKSIAQAVSLAEMTELTIKASRRPSGEEARIKIRQGAQLNQIGAEVSGEVDEAKGEEEEVEGTQVDVVKDREDLIR